jgi:hypothetical protein
MDYQNECGPSLLNTELQSAERCSLSKYARCSEGVEQCLTVLIDAVSPAVHDMKNGM